MFKLNIFGIKQDDFVVELGDDEVQFKNKTVKEVKQIMIREQALPLEVDEILLIFVGIQLEDDRVLDSYGITNDSTLMALQRVSSE